MKTAQDLLDKLLELESNTQRELEITEFLNNKIKSIIIEVVEICDAHAEQGCFDKEGALANSLNLMS